MGNFVFSNGPIRYDVRSFEGKKGLSFQLTKDEHVLVRSLFEKGCLSASDV